MAPEQITLSTEAPAVPMPPFAFVYQFRWLNERSERAVYGFETIADALYDKPGIQPDDPGHRITVEVEPVIVRFEDLHERDRAAYLAAHAEYLTDCAEGLKPSRSMDHAIYYLEDGEAVPTPAAVEIPPEAREEVRRRIHRMYPGLAAARSGHQPGSYAEYVARREARLERKAEKRGEWAEGREAKAEAAHKRAHAIIDVIPPGQPILVGHHSERGHRRDLALADSAMSQAVEHSKMAEKHAHKARACAAALDRQYKPEFCDARIKEAEAGIRKCDRELLYCKAHKSDQASIDHWNAWKARYTEQRDFWTARLEAVGGLAVATTDGIEKGDIIDTSHGQYEVFRVNKKTVTIKGWMRIESMTFKFPVSAIKSVIKRAEA